MKEDFVMPVESTKEDKPVPINRVRVLRIVEYVGTREWVEDVVSRSIHGRRYFGGSGNYIGGTTLGEFPSEVMDFESNRDDEIVLFEAQRLLVAKGLMRLYDPFTAGDVLNGLYKLRGQKDSTA
jgi:hypothetical protein